MSDSHGFKGNELPSEWFVSGGRPAQYIVKVDVTMSHSGTRSACMENIDDRPDDFGTLMQESSAVSFLNKRGYAICAGL